MQKRELYKRLREAAQAQGADAVAVERLSARAVRTAIGPEAAGVSATLLENMKQRLAAELRRKEMQAVGEWIVSRLQSRFAAVQVRSGRPGVVEVWLDGLPKESEQ